MTSKTNAARPAVKAAACLDTGLDTVSLDTARADAMQTADHDDQPLDIHEMYKRNKCCGLSQDVLLTEFEAQAISTRLDGLNALSALFIAADDTDSIHLSGWLTGGLRRAMYALAEDAQAVLYRANDRAVKAGKGSAA